MEEKEICGNCERWVCVCDEWGKCCNSSLRLKREYTQDCSFFVKKQYSSKMEEENDL